ncbi:hypothetical protein [Ethanoligenens sp.]|uniref:hypothetical protein n=1 Tax=Ethanoligenens sp. TaxID=2099655 RepID=UPI0039ED9C2C
MLQLIAGSKGTGKTKKIMGLAKVAVAQTSGKVAFIEKGTALTYDLPHDVRLFNTDDYEIDGADAFYGFLAGIAASDYDMKHIYVDSVVKIVGDNPALVTGFIDKVDHLAKKQEIEIVMTLSRDASEFPANITQFIVTNLT